MQLLVTATRSSFMFHASCCLFVLGVGRLMPLLEDDEGRKAGWNRKENEKECMTSFCNQGLAEPGYLLRVFTQGHSSDGDGAKRGEKRGEEKSKKTHAKKLRRAVARRVRLPFLPYFIVHRHTKTCPNLLSLPPAPCRVGSPNLRHCFRKQRALASLHVIFIIDTSSSSSAGQSSTSIHSPSPAKSRSSTINDPFVPGHPIAIHHTRQPHLCYPPFPFLRHIHSQ